MGARANTLSDVMATNCTMLQARKTCMSVLRVCSVLCANVTTNTHVRRGCHGNSSSPSGPVRQDGPRHLSHQLGGRMGAEAETGQKRGGPQHRRDTSFLGPCMRLWSQVTVKETRTQPSGGSQSGRSHRRECRSAHCRGRGQSQDGCGAERGGGGQRRAPWLQSSAKPSQRRGLSAGC